MYGIEPGKIKIGMTLKDILELRVAAGSCPEDSQKYIKDRIREAFLPDPGYLVNKLRDGRTLAICRRTMPDGGSVAVHQDITAHLNTEQELDETKQFLNSIIENIPIAVVVKDAVTRKFVLVNRAFEAMLKVDRDDVLGKTVFEIYQRKDAERIDTADNEDWRAHSAGARTTMKSRCRMAKCALSPRAVSSPAMPLARQDTSLSSLTILPSEKDPSSGSPSWRFTTC
jgi:PAS domain-containing protein